MRRFVKWAAAAALLAAASPAAAQPLNALDLQAGRPSGLALPFPGVAAAEEPSAMGATPAAPGFVGAPAIQWFREGEVVRSSTADGLYAAAGAGPLGIGYSVEWVHPGEVALASYRKNKLALTLGDHHAWSLGFGWNRYWSSQGAISSIASWDAGLTVRPWRHLSIGLAALDRDAWLGGTKLPARYDLGLATRFLSDVLTVSADLLADDRARDDFHTTHLGAAVQAEVSAGFALGTQLLFPLHSEPGPSAQPLPRRVRVVERGARGRHRRASPGRPRAPAGSSACAARRSATPPRCRGGSRPP